MNNIRNTGTKPVRSGETITYYAAASSASEDNKYCFLINEVHPGCWRAYIKRTPSYGSRDTSPNIIHKYQSDAGEYVCIRSGDPTTVTSLLSYVMLWADRTQRYIRTGKAINKV